MHRLLQFSSHAPGNVGLRLVVAKDPAGVLKASIVALSIFGGRVVKGKEEADQFFEMPRWFIQFNVQYFDVSRFTTTDLLVGWILVFGCWLFGCHETHGTVSNGIWKVFLKVDSNILFGSPITTRTESELAGNRSRAISRGWCRRGCYAVGLALPATEQSTTHGRNSTTTDLVTDLDDLVSDLLFGVSY